MMLHIPLIFERGISPCCTTVEVGAWFDIILCNCWVLSLVSCFTFLWVLSVIAYNASQISICEHAFRSVLSAVLLMDIMLQNR